MAIDIANETVISLSEARGRLPRRRGNKRPDLSCLYRWTDPKIGCRGVILESIQVGNCRCTSLEALARFFAKLSRVDAPVARPATLRRRAIERAEVSLSAEGF